MLTCAVMHVLRQEFLCTGVGGSQATGLGSAGTDSTNFIPSNTGSSTAVASAKAQAQSGFTGGDTQAAAQAIATSGSSQDVADAFSQAYSQGTALTLTSICTHGSLSWSPLSSCCLLFKDH